MPLEFGFGKQVHLSENQSKKDVRFFFPLMPRAGGMALLSCIRIREGCFASLVGLLGVPGESG